MDSENGNALNLGLRTTMFLENKKNLKNLVIILISEIKKLKNKPNKRSKPLKNNKNKNKSKQKNPHLLVSVFYNIAIKKFLKIHMPLGIVFIELIRQEIKKILLYFKNKTTFLFEIIPKKNNRVVLIETHSNYLKTSPVLT